MGLHVAVVDPLPMFRRGVAAVLSAAGHRVDSPEDVRAWTRSHERSVVLLTLHDRHAWDLLAGLRDTASARAASAGTALVGTALVGTACAGIIAVLAERLADEPPGTTGVRAVRAGATSVLPRASGPGELLRTVEATAAGQAVVPVEVLAALASEASRPLPEERLSWLRHLAGGRTVAELARRVGYSERAMFRMLRSLYREMGVENRLQAVLRAQELGWLPSGDSSSRRP